jgi:hypothetical protein
MSRTEFNYLCQNNGVSPDIALENERVRSFLRSIHGKSHHPDQQMWYDLALSKLLQEEF